VDFPPISPSSPPQSKDEKEDHDNPSFVRHGMTAAALLNLVLKKPLFDEDDDAGDHDQEAGI